MALGAGVQLSELHKFEGFEEKLFNEGGGNESTIDKGLLFAFLKEKGFSNIFNLYFGVEGKLSTQTSVPLSK